MISFFQKNVQLRNMIVSPIKDDSDSSQNKSKVDSPKVRKHQEKLNTATNN